MLRQPHLYLGIFLFFSSTSWSAQPPNSTYTVPTKTEEQKLYKKEVQPVHMDQGLDFHARKLRKPPNYFEYHLPMKQSFGFMLSRALQMSNNQTNGWADLQTHFAYTPTSRWAAEVGFKRSQFWAKGSWQIISSRNRIRYFYGPQVSLYLPADEELRPLVDIDRYFAGGVCGFEFQMTNNVHIRSEGSILLGIKESYLRAGLGLGWNF